MINTLPVWLMFRNIAYSRAINFGLSKTENTTTLGIVLIRKKMKNMSQPASDIVEKKFCYYAIFLMDVHRQKDNLFSYIPSISRFLYCA